MPTAVGANLVCMLLRRSFIKITPIQVGRNVACHHDLQSSDDRCTSQLQLRQARSIISVDQARAFLSLSLWRTPLLVLDILAQAEKSIPNSRVENLGLH